CARPRRNHASAGADTGRVGASIDMGSKPRHDRRSRRRTTNGRPTPDAVDGAIPGPSPATAPAPPGPGGAAGNRRSGGGREATGNGGGPVAGGGGERRRPRLRKLRVLLLLAGLAVLAFVSWIFGIMMALAQ